MTSQTAVITAVLYYFGWARTRATLSYFGVDTSLVAYSTVDYVLRSISVAFVPFVGATLAAFAALGLHRVVVVRALAAPADSRIERLLGRVLLAAQLLAIALAGVVVVGLIVQRQVGIPLGIVLPLLLVVSTVMLGYVGYLRSVRAAPVQTGEASRTGSAFDRLRALALIALGILGVFWSTGLYADRVGNRIATEIAAGLRGSPEIVLFTTERLALAGSGLKVDEIMTAGNKYRYQYSGLRLLIRTDDKYLLIPVGWQKGRDRVFLVRDDGSVRIDVAAR